jgi:S-formylglutathione hydrolase FrmB
MQRLEEDVLRGTSYAHVWLIGPSMGGHGTLLYPSRKPGIVTGVFALAPWLGNSVPQEITNAGGLSAWKPGDGTEFERQFWTWLQQVTVKGEPGPELWLGFGTADRLAKSDEVLAAALPADHVFRADGAHNWKTWRALLAQFLERSTFTQQCAP